MACTCEESLAIRMGVEAAYLSAISKTTQGSIYILPRRMPGRLALAWEDLAIADYKSTDRPTDRSKKVSSRTTG